ncbi:MAG: hypothetical protein AAF666_18465, partial [Pseudomonadota bacterium]
MSAEAEEAYALAEQRIAQAKAEGWRELFLSGDGVKRKDFRRSGNKNLKALESLPPQISDLENLRQLSLNNTNIDNIDYIHNLQQIERLNISHTNISARKNSIFFKSLIKDKSEI